MAGILPDASGQDLVEYAFLVGGIAILLIVAVEIFADELSDAWQGIADAFPS